MTDILERFVPALSATSDAPDMGVTTSDRVPALSEAVFNAGKVVNAAPESVTETSAPAAELTAEPESAEGEEQDPVAEAAAESEPKEVEAAPAPKEDKEPSGVGKALEAQRALIREAQDRAFAAEQRAAEAIRAMEALSARIPEPAPVVETQDPRPAREGFGDPEAYDRALTDWSGRQAARAIKSELQAQATVDREAATKKAAEDKAFLEAQEVELKWSERRVKAIEKNPDFESVTTSNDLPISQIMANYIKQNENGPDLAYHLGKNIDEAKRIYGMHPVQQIEQLAILSHTLKTPKAVVTKAPAPIRPHRPSSSPANRKTPEEMSMDEYAAHRLDSIRASARRPGSAIH